MPAYKDKKANTWYVKFYYKDYHGNRKQKWKGGFALKREAEEYERNFLQTRNYEPDMLFSNFVALYLADVEPRLREHTMQTKRYQINNHILPPFGDMKLNEIDANKIRSWQNELISGGYRNATLRSIHGTISAIFNHAVKYYGLRVNPVKLAGQPKASDDVKELPMRFWTYEEYKQAIDCIDDIKAKTAIMLLYWTGMRKGELLALTWDKLDFETNTLLIDRSYQRLKGKAKITPTKTNESRKIELPKQMIDQLKLYRAACYQPMPKDHIFDWEKRFIEQGIKQACEASGVKPIHVHGLRHSHASLLISMGVNIVLISKRLGHERVSTTLDTYSHFFPDDEKKVIQQLEQL